MATLHISIVTAERSLLEDDVDMVIAPGSEGELGILPMHAPLLTMVSPGEIRLKKGAGESSFAVTGGFLEVRDNRVTILADAAERADEIDLARAEAAMKKAQEAIKAAPHAKELEEATKAFQRATLRLKVARKKRGTGAPNARE
jgi:F-type H+-transporting ATPase subunit epsilon